MGGAWLVSGGGSSFFLLEHPGPAARPQGQGPVSGDPAAYPASAAAGLIGRDLRRKLLCVSAISSKRL